MEGELQSEYKCLLRDTAKAIKFMRERQSLAVKVFRESMDKNTLILFAINRTLCFYINLRVFNNA